MTTPEHSPPILAPAPRWTWRRLIAAIIVCVVILSAIGFAALKYFIYCGNCGPSPILCTDPCPLPKFGQANFITGT